MSALVQLQHEFYNRLMESQYLPPEERVLQQRRDLAKLLRHAQQNVPFYRDRLNGVLSKDGGIDWDKWNEIPIVKRSDLLNRRAEMLASSMPRGHGQIHESKSSGSTGPRITISSSEYSSAFTRAALYRAHGWHGIDWSRPILYWWDDSAGLPDSSRPGPVWGPPWVSEAVGRQVVLGRQSDAAEILTYMRNHDVGYLAVKPMSAHVLALEAIRLGIRPRLDAILAHGTAARPEENNACRAAFGARMILGYSGKEGQLMAYPCPDGRGYHVNEETVLLEILDADDEPCAVGEVGRVIVTPIFNFAQPLIRYEQGDLAVVGQRCSCGRTLKVIDRIVGRQESLFRFPDGSNVALSLSFTLMEEFGAAYWQVAQVEPLAIEVRYVWSGTGTCDEVKVADTIRADTRQSVHITFKRVNDIARGPGGKFIPYVYEVGQ